MHTKHIDICHHFIRYMFKEKDMDIKYINSEENPTDIITKNCLEIKQVNTQKEDHGRKTLGVSGNWKGGYQ